MAAPDGSKDKRDTSYSFSNMINQIISFDRISKKRSEKVVPDGFGDATSPKRVVGKVKAIRLFNHLGVTRH